MGLQSKNLTYILTFTRASGGTSFRPVSYGPELAGLSSAWQSYGAGISLSGGQMVFNAAPAGQFAMRGKPLAATKIYYIEFTVSAISGGSLSMLISGGEGVIGVSTPGTYRTTAKSNGADGPYLWVASGTVTATVTVAICKEVTLDRPGDPIQLFTAPTNVPRFDYDPVTRQCRGLLVEEQRTNLVTRSHEFDDVIWNKSQSSISANAGIAPDGSQAADLLTASATSIQHYMNGGGASIAANTAGTLSVYAKASGLNTVALSASGSNLFMAEYNLATGVVASQVGGTATIQSVGSGWYRCSLTCTTTAFAFAPYIFPGGYAAFVGNNTDGVLIWGAQHEVGAFPTSYIPTTGAAATRAADVASVNTLSPWYNPAEGTLFVDVGSSKASGDGNAAAASLDGPTLGADYVIAVLNVANSAMLATGGSTATSAAATAGPSAVKIAVGMSPASQVLVVNGSAPVQRSVAAPLASFSVMRLGHWSANPGHLNGHIRRIQYIPKRLSDAKLQALTA